MKFSYVFRLYFTLLPEKWSADIQKINALPCVINKVRLFGVLGELHKSECKESFMGYFIPHRRGNNGKKREQSKKNHI